MEEERRERAARRQREEARRERERQAEWTRSAEEGYGLTYIDDETDQFDRATRIYDLPTMQRDPGPPHQEDPFTGPAGGEKDEQGDLRGWAQFPESEWLDRSLFSLKQDTKMLDERIVRFGGRFLREIVEKRNFDPASVNWFLPHLSSMYFKEKIKKELDVCGYDIPWEKWFVNLPDIGNIASVSAFAMLEALGRSVRLKSGDTILLMVPESARFSYAFALLTVC
jgi:3-oxoacyl-[acyl-carrier-protein] synthase III